MRNWSDTAATQLAEQSQDRPRSQRPAAFGQASKQAAKVLRSLALPAALIVFSESRHGAVRAAARHSVQAGSQRFVQLPVISQGEAEHADNAMHSNNNRIARGYIA